MLKSSRRYKFKISWHPFVYIFCLHLRTLVFNSKKSFFNIRLYYFFVSPLQFELLKPLKCMRAIIYIFAFLHRPCKCKVNLQYLKTRYRQYDVANFLPKRAYYKSKPGHVPRYINTKTTSNNPVSFAPYTQPVVKYSAELIYRVTFS